MNKVKYIQNIANQLKKDSLEMTTRAGSGHPTSCLSCAEILGTLFFDEMKYDTKNPFNQDNDEFILSKGHAAPILYAALYRSKCIKDNLKDLRRITSNLEGHPVPKSLDWIKVATGSLGQGLSVGVGMALASKMQKRKFRVYVLIGDSESAEGSVFEALELASHYKLNNLTAIIDINRLGQRGETLLGHNIKKYKERFKGFGWKVISINGHNISQVLNAFKKAKNQTKPTLILAQTFKGNGISFLQNKEGFHGKVLNEEELKRALKELPKINKFKPKINSPQKTKFKFKKTQIIDSKYTEKTATRSAYGKALASLAKSDSSIIAIDAEVSNSTYSEEVKKTNPEQFIEAFIAEQNMVGMALGLSTKEYNVFVSTFSAFLSRAHDQIRMSAVSSANITFCGSHSGVSIGEDGVSQMGLEDIAMFRAIPESIIFYPSDAVSADKLTKLCSNIEGIKYIRTTRAKTPILYKNTEKFSIGDFKVLKKSAKDKAVLIGSGITLHEAKKAHDTLKKQGENTALIDLYCIKPFNIQKFIKFVKNHGNRIVIAEDHYSEGGIGEMLAKELINTKIKIKALAVNKIPHSGKPEELIKKYKIDSKSYVKAIEEQW